MLEKTIQQKLAYILDGVCEVNTPIGRIDVLTNNSVIEVKHVKYFKAAMGQVLSYGVYYPSHKKKLYLFGRVSKRRRWDIELACKKFDVEVIFEGSIILD